VDRRAASDRLIDSGAWSGVAVIGPAAVIALLSVTILWTMARGADARRWVAHTQAVLAACDATLVDIQDAQAGQRGYLLTGDRDDLAPYEAGRQALATDTAHLREMTRDNPVQQHRIDALERLLAARVALMDSTIAVRASGPPTAAIALFRSGRGRALTDSVRLRLAELAREEQQLLAVREERLEGLRTALLAVVIGGGLLAIAIALLTSTMLRADAVRRAAHVRELAAANDRLREQQAELEHQAEQLHEQQVELESSNAHLHDQTRDLEDLAHRLKQSDRRLRYILETIPSGIIEADRQGTYIYANAAAERILALDRSRMRDGIITGPDWELTSRDGRVLAAHERPIGIAIDTRAPVNGFELVVLIRETGRRIVLRANAAPLYEGEESEGERRITGVLSAFDDVTAEVAATDRLRTILDSGVVGVFSWNVGEGIVDANPAFLAMLGYTTDDIPSLRYEFMRITPPEFRARSEQAARELMATGRHAAFRKAYYAKDGTAVPVVVASAFVNSARRDGVSLCLDAREQSAVETALRDIQAALAARLEAEQVARGQAEMLQGLSSALASAFTPDAVIEVASREAAAASGAVTAQIRLTDGIAVRDLADATEDPSPLGDVMREGRARWLGSTRAIVDAYPRYPGRDGGAPTSALCAIPLAIGGELAPRTLGALALAFAEPQPFDEAQQRLLTTIADQIAQALERSHLYRDAQVANETKSGFMATMSHELRTPLNALLGYAELLMLGVPDPIPSSAQSHVSRMRLAARHLLGLIDEILLHARLEAGREVVLRERVDLSTLLDEVASVIEPLAHAKGLEFVVERGDGRAAHAVAHHVDQPAPPLIVEIDAGKLRQILINLAGNAVKFTDSGRVTLRLTCRMAEHIGARRINGADGARRINGADSIDEIEELRFDVTDTGIGIARDDVPRVFEYFWQARQGSGTQRPAGTGLGLAVTRRLVDLLGGEVSLTSTAGAGSTFTVRLPVAKTVIPTGGDRTKGVPTR